MKLNNWTFVISGSGNLQINGDIEGDIKGRWQDGTNITTSRIQLLNLTGNEVHTLNSAYELGNKKDDNLFGGF